MNKTSFSIFCLVFFVMIVAWGVYVRMKPEPHWDWREHITVEDVSKQLQLVPGDYFAAVQKVADNSACESKGGDIGKECLVKMRVIEYLGGSDFMNRNIQLQGEYNTVEWVTETPWPNRIVGRTRLVVLTPKPKDPTNYHNSLLIIDPTPEEITKLKQVIAKIGSDPAIANTLRFLKVIVPNSSNSFMPGDKITKEKVAVRQVRQSDIIGSVVAVEDFDKIENKTVNKQIQSGEALTYEVIVDL